MLPPSQRRDPTPLGSTVGLRPAPCRSPKVACAPLHVSPRLPPPAPGAAEHQGPALRASLTPGHPAAQRPRPRQGALLRGPYSHPPCSQAPGSPRGSQLKVKVTSGLTSSRGYRNAQQRRSPEQPPSPGSPHCRELRGTVAHCPEELGSAGATGRAPTRRPRISSAFAPWDPQGRDIPPTALAPLARPWSTPGVQPLQGLRQRGGRGQGGPGSLPQETQRSSPRLWPQPGPRWLLPAAMDVPDIVPRSA